MALDDIIIVHDQVAPFGRQYGVISSNQAGIAENTDDGITALSFDFDNLILHPDQTSPFVGMQNGQVRTFHVAHPETGYLSSNVLFLSQSVSFVAPPASLAGSPDFPRPRAYYYATLFCRVGETPQLEIRLAPFTPDLTLVNANTGNLVGINGAQLLAQGDALTFGTLAVNDTLVFEVEWQLSTDVAIDNKPEVTIICRVGRATDLSDLMPELMVCYDYNDVVLTVISPGQLPSNQYNINHGLGVMLNEPEFECVFNPVGLFGVDFRVVGTDLLALTILDEFWDAPSDSLVPVEIIDEEWPDPTDSLVPTTIIIEGWES